jgi:hypothetical protein
MARVGAAGLATSVMARANALGIGSDAELTQLYEQREAALLAPSLAAELVVPLTVVDIEFEEQLPLSEHVWIERMQDKLQIARAPDDSSIYAVFPPLAGAAVVAVVVGGLTLENAPRWKRQWRTASKVCHWMWLTMSAPHSKSDMRTLRAGICRLANADELLKLG